MTTPRGRHRSRVLLRARDSGRQLHRARGGVARRRCAMRGPDTIRQTLSDPLIRSAIRLSLLSSTITTILALWVAVPLGYLLSRVEFPGKAILDTILDVPIVLPPLVIGISLLILFQLPLGQAIEA